MFFNCKINKQPRLNHMNIEQERSNSYRLGKKLKYNLYSLIVLVPLPAIIVLNVFMDVYCLKFTLLKIKFNCIKCM